METVRQAGAVTLVLALLLLTLWWLRRRGVANLRGGFTTRKGSPYRLELLERVVLGPQNTLHLVRLDATSLLISASPSGCVLLHRAELGERGSAGGAQ